MNLDSSQSLFLEKFKEELKIFKNDFFILTGAAGTGKTELIKESVEYCEEHDIEISTETEIIEDSKQKRKRGDAKKKSLELFKSGKSISEIANERELNVNTIFGHLASFIISGEVKITDLVPKVHYEELKEIIPKKKFDTLSDLKRQLDDKYSYGELRLVLDELKT